MIREWPNNYDYDCHSGRRWATPNISLNKTRLFIQWEMVWSVFNLLVETKVKLYQNVTTMGASVHIRNHLFSEVLQSTQSIFFGNYIMLILCKRVGGCVFSCYSFQQHSPLCLIKQWKPQTSTRYTQDQEPKAKRWTAT